MVLYTSIRMYLLEKQTLGIRYSRNDKIYIADVTEFIYFFQYLKICLFIFP